MGDPQRTISFDDLVGALGSVERRQLLTDLLVDDTQHIPRADHGSERSVRRLQLWHIHLPKLENMRLIEWNPSTDVVGRGPAFDEARPLLTLLSEAQNELPEDYLRSDTTLSRSYRSN